MESNAVKSAGQNVPRAEAGDQDDMSFLTLANVLLRNYRLIIGLGMLALVGVLAVGLALPRTYTTVAAFSPQSRKFPSAFSGLAAQFGIGLPGLEGNQSPEFYADLVTSREVLESVVDSPYTVTRETGLATVSLVDFLRAKGPTPARRREAAMKRLLKRMTVSTKQRTGVIRVTVALQDPEVAFQVGSRILDLINRFNLESRQSQAGAERRFTQTRLGEVQTALREAEDRLQAFRQRNRDFRNSAELAFQQERLARDVGMKQQIYTTLAQAYEQARIEEVRDTPVITVIEKPEAAVQPDPRGLAVKALLAFVAASLIGVFFAFALEAWRAGGTDQADAAEEFARLRRVAFDDLRRIWRLGRA